MGIRSDAARGGPLLASLTAISTGAAAGSRPGTAGTLTNAAARPVRDFLDASRP